MSANRYAMRKGALPIIALVLVIVAGVMVTEGIYLNNFIKDIEVIKRSAREMVIVSAVNTVEFRKRALQNAVAYSFQAAAMDVFGSGGFCAHDGSYCDGVCKIPGSVPTFGCVPWWKVYGSVHAPAEDGGPRSFVAYLENRTAAVYDDYAQSISKGGMSYCPTDPAFAVETAGSYSVRVSTTASATPFQNKKDIKTGEKLDSVVITESNTVFASTFESSALDMFSFARSRFASGNDAVKAAFTDAAGSMPEECKKAEVGSICENADSGVCDAKLEAYCTSDAAGSACDYNGDGRLTADERYRCAVESELGSAVESGDGRIRATVSAGCVKTGHSSSLSGTTTYDCSKVVGAGCGCSQRCTPSMCGCASEGSECGDCSACGAGVNAEWVRHDSCTGSNTFDCGSFGADNCPSPCCDLVESGKSPSGDPIYSCSKVRCSDVGFDSCPTSCGCSKRTSWTFECSGLSEGCGLSNGCCIRPYGVVEDAACNYNYFGSANASVVVQDTGSAYLSGLSWKQPSLQFYVASGNADCGVNAVENPSEPGGACCAAAATNSADKLKGCKTA